MKKVLIWTKFLGVANVGGPCGYLYNIKRYLDEVDLSEVEFFETLPFEKWPIRNKIAYYVPSVINKKLPKYKLLVFIVDVFFRFFFRCGLSNKDIDLINQYEFVHVHLSTEMIQLFYNKKRIKAKIILTTHNPEPYIDELAGIHNCKDFLCRHKKIRNFLIRKEVEAYDLCDYIMFPVKEAKEAYKKASVVYQNIFAQYDAKFFYVPTALGFTEPVIENDNLLLQYNIPKDQIKICYVGRHNEVKGYDQIKKVAEMLWERGISAFFIIGGNEGPMYGLTDSRWIELGWVNTARLLNEVDIFVLPNQNTYYDLIMLEALRQGTPIIASYTGGNKWFENKNLDGIKFFNYGNIDELFNAILEYINLFERGLKNKIKDENIQFCKKNCGMELYIERYIKSLNNISNEYV